jgi:curved DNA-binding protein CbpA
VLGVPPSASEEAFKSRFKELALAHHPDRGGDPAQMRRYLKAYDQIRNGKRVSQPPQPVRAQAQPPRLRRARSAWRARRAQALKGSVGAAVEAPRAPRRQGRQGFDFPRCWRPATSLVACAARHAGTAREIRGAGARPESARPLGSPARTVPR